jgi:hypothetical protein
MLVIFGIQLVPSYCQYEKHAQIILLYIPNDHGTP